MNRLILLYLMSFMSYSFYSYINYSKKIKESIYFFPMGILLSLIGNLFWLLISKEIKSDNKMIIYALIFDGMVMTTFTLIPVLLFGIKLNMTGMIGLMITATGLILLKLSLSSG